MGRGAATLEHQEAQPRVADLQIGYAGRVDLRADAIASGWRLDEAALLHDYRTNGRHSSRMLERRVARLLGGQVTADGAPFDMLLAEGTRIEVKSLSGSVSFAASGSVGSGRRCSADDLAAKLDSVDAYVICDVRAFPHVHCWLVPSSSLRQWIESGTLGTQGRMGRAKFLRLVGRHGLARLSHGEPATQADPSAIGNWRVGISIECTALGHEMEKRLGVDTDLDMAEAFSVLRAAFVREQSGAAVDAARRQGCAAARAILASLAIDEIASAATERFHLDTIEVLYLAQIDEGEQQLLLEVGPSASLLDLIARFARSRSDTIVEAFYEAVADASVLSSSTRGRNLGYSVDPDAIWLTPS